MNNKKYKLSNITMKFEGRTLYRVIALKDFANVKKGDLGGWVSSEDNLSHYGNCWVYNNAMCMDNSRMFDNSKMYNGSRMFGNSRMRDDSIMFNNSTMYGRSEMNGNSKCCHNQNFTTINRKTIIFLYTLFICVIVIAGCDRQQGTVISENTVYYAYRETGSM